MLFGKPATIPTKAEALPGRALGLAVANGALLVSTDTGAIISFGQADDQPSAWILF